MALQLQLKMDVVIRLDKEWRSDTLCGWMEKECLFKCLVYNNNNNRKQCVVIDDRVWGSIGELITHPLVDIITRVIQPSTALLMSCEGDCHYIPLLLYPHS